MNRQWNLVIVIQIAVLIGMLLLTLKLNATDERLLDTCQFANTQQEVAACIYEATD